MKKVEELKDLGCSVRGRFYDLAWSKPVLRAPAVHGVSSITIIAAKPHYEIEIVTWLSKKLGFTYTYDRLQ